MKLFKVNIYLIKICNYNKFVKNLFKKKKKKLIRVLLLYMEYITHLKFNNYPIIKIKNIKKKKRYLQLQEEKRGSNCPAFCNLYEGDESVQIQSLMWHRM